MSYLKRSKKILLLFLFLFINIVYSQNTKVPWSAFNMGFASSTQSNISVKSAVGQVFVGGTKESNFYIESGFLVDTLLRGTLVSVKEGQALPSSFMLHQNYPNPFNPITTIRFELPHAAKVKLTIYNLLGQEIMVLMEGETQAGFYEVRFDGVGLPSGVYFYRLVTGEYTSIKKLIIAK